MNYNEFIAKKSYIAKSVGFVCGDINDNAMPHQKAIIPWACKRGKAAIFADTGLGKSFMQLEWARLVSGYTSKPVLLLAPLAVGKQTENESNKFGIECSTKYVREPSPDCDIQIANYEMIHVFNPDSFGGIVLDESSILKGQSGAYRKTLTEFAKNIPYRLSCTATPSPNDYMELGTQAEFLGVMSQSEMLATFFIHDGSETQKWRLKGHGATKFWEWLATWAVVISSPSDLGFDGSDYELPKLTIEPVILPSEIKGSLFANIAQGLNEARKSKKESMQDRCEAVSEWVNSLDDQCLVWGELNEECDLLERLINDSVQVAGRHKAEVKEERLLGFGKSEFKHLVSKTKIAGFGMNWQNACKMAFSGPTYSFEGFYQAVRREWRFGQSKEVLVKVFMSDKEVGIHEAMIRKMEQDKIMRQEMVKVMGNAMKQEIFGATPTKSGYKPSVSALLPKFL